jgi:hypothetical protein
MHQVSAHPIFYPTLMSDGWDPANMPTQAAIKLDCDLNITQVKK